MRNSLLFAFVLLTVSSVVTAQNSSWQWVNPLPQGNLLNGLWTVNAETTIAVGDLGTILRTTNGGLTWEVEQNAGGLDNQLFNTQFISSSVGWAVGEFGTILKTTDGGVTWFQQMIQTYYDLYSVCFVSPTVGWVTGSGGLIFQTIDGGDTWTLQNSNTTATFFAIYFRTSTIGWAVGTSGIILQTTNGGANWFSVNSGTIQTLYAIQFASPTIGYISGSFGVVLKTLNGGSSWVSLNTGSSESFYALEFTSSLVGWAAGSYGAIMKTTDGGTDWFMQASQTQNDLYGISSVSSTSAYMVGDYGTMLETPDGTNWLQISNGPDNTLYGMYFLTSSHGYALGDIGTILQTQDGGKTWTTQISGTYKALYGASFVTSTTGWVVGDSATILKTTNGGASWSEQNSHTDPTLYSVYFGSATNGWTVGDYGTILATTNGGVAWVAETSNVPASLLRIQFATSSIGWAIGYDGTIVKTTNGGKKWITQNSGTYYSLSGIAIIDQNTVCLAGDNGLILRTTDGGTTWTPSQTDSYSSFYGISFLNASLGWTAGDDGTIMGTNDGGITWHTQNPITPVSFYEIQAVHGSSGGIVYASGEGGTIISSAVSPLPIRLWTGASDSLWFNPSNWNPVGTPEKIDSVYIPATTRNPSLQSPQQQVDIGALTIGSNAKLSISAAIATMTIKNGITILGTLQLDPTARTEIYTGGSFSAQFSGVFSPGNSTVVFTGNGQLKGSFYSIILQETSSMQSFGNITVNHNLNALTNLYLRSADTLTITNPDPAAFEGPGFVTPGTIRRAIQPGSGGLYRFESFGTYLEFYPQGTAPSVVSITAFPGSLPPSLSDTVFVRRYYSINATGGSNYMAYLSLRYDTSETAISIENLALFRDSGGVVTNMGSTDFLDSDIVALSLDSVRSFSQWYFGNANYFPRHPYEFIDTLFVQDNGGKRDTLVFGANAGATDGIDALFGEAVLPAIPPTGTFDARMILPSTQGSKIDIRNLLDNVVQQQRTYNMNVQPGPGGYPMTIRWDSTGLANGTFFMRDQSTHGGQFNISMKAQSAYSVTGSSTSAIEIVHKIPVFYSFVNGWNLVSMPLNPTSSATKIATFPTAISEAFGYNGGYFIEDTLQKDVGYWIKFAYDQSIGFEGTPRTKDTIPVSLGWNLIGAGSSSVAKGSIVASPTTGVVSNYFQYSSGYVVADSLRPSRAYWVKVSGNGSLYATGSSIQKSSAGISNELDFHKLNSLTITDRHEGKQHLYFVDQETQSVPMEEYELPPLPPGGIFDARFSSGSMVEALPLHQSSHLIQIQSSGYPVNIQWHLNGTGIRSLSFLNPATSRQLFTSHSTTGTFEISDPSMSKVRIDLEYEPSLPRQYSLAQNYPNPFNPTTQIIFQLPADARVTLKVFDILGQVVMTLSDQQLYNAGTHMVTFNGTTLGSGVYFCQIEAHGFDGKVFRQTRKMLMIK